MLKNKIRSRFVRNALVMTIVFLAFFLFDQLTKYFLFHYPGNPDIAGNVQHDFVLFGVRSLLHKSTTFLDFIGIKFPHWANILIGFVLSAIFIFIIIFNKTRGLSVGFSIVLAGIIGNTVDNIWHLGVRDIFFIPWFDRGTFNLADALVVIGLIWVLIGFIIDLILMWKRKKTLN